MATVLEEREGAPSDKSPKKGWGNSSISEPMSLLDVMSEQLAVNLQDQENSKSVSTPNICDDNFTLNETEYAANTDNDLIVAQLLQLQFDREYDEIIDKTEKKYNGASKVSVSFNNFRMVPRGSLWEEESSSEEDIDDENRSWDVFEDNAKDSPTIPRCGYAKQETGFVTKHDIPTSNRRNACRIMEFPPGIETGDGGGFDMQLDNKCYNALKVHACQEQKRKMRIIDKSGRSTAEIAMDPKTRLILHKMIDNGLLESVTGSISTGKEAVVLHAVGGQLEDQEITQHCAIKVFKTTLNEFKNRDQYIQDDIRFKDRFSKLNPRKIIHLWAEKEKRNLSRLEQAGIPCPHVWLLQKHVLVMSFVGEEEFAAPKLKDVTLSANRWKVVYETVISYAKKMYEECQLVHADLSEYNLLWHDHKVYVIDVSQSVDLAHPHALQFLFRDCYNIFKFFSRHVKNIKSAEELFTDVSGVQLEGEGDTIDKIREYENSITKSKRINRVADFAPGGERGNNESFQGDFDCMWEKAISNKSH